MRTSNRSFLMKYAVPAIGAIAAAALMLRIVACICLASTPAAANPSVQTDMATYLRLSAEILRGQWPDHFDYQPFYYTVFLPLCRLIGGDSHWPAMLLQAFLGSMAVWLAGISAARLFGKAAGITTAILLAFSKIHVFYTPFMLLEVLQSFWLALILWLTLVCWRRNKFLYWCILALAVSAATLTRGNAALLAPGMLVFAIWRNWNRKAAALVLAIAMLALFQLPQLPFSIVNYRYTGRWCGASTAGDKVLALGNTPEAPPGGLEYPLTYHKWCADSDKRPGEGRISVPRHILSWMLKEPMAFLELKFRALLLFWSHHEIANNVSLQAEGRECFLTARPLLLSFNVIGPMALLGLLFIARRLSSKGGSRIGIAAPGILALLYMLLSSWFGTALFYNLSRFRLSALPVLCVSGGAGFQIFMNIRRIFKTVEDRQTRRRMLQACSLPLLFSIFLVYSAYSSYQAFIEPAAMRLCHPDGMVVDFDDTTLVYDHGPLSFGGFNFIEVPEKGIDVVKVLAIPRNAPSGPAKVRFPVYLPAGASFSGTMQHDGRSYGFGPASIVSDRFHKWVELEVPAISAREDNLAVFIWHFNGCPGMGIGVDRLRNYRRSTYILEGNTQMAFAAEAAMEMQWFK